MEPFFTFRKGFRYRWWRSDFGTALIAVTALTLVMGMMLLVVWKAMP